ncbi:complement C1q-like protein 2 [Mercenaria mercenaria]|uniref:complement C1q-like protein 2 n=1 Tax=Mercenaria mercenaria TaxID=6596 RepID=UPI00234EB353|nr:complement C1q-like protein 2 [Mercenaria mercenaria]
MKILFAAIFAILLSLAIASDSTNVEKRNDLNDVGTLLNHHQTMEVVVQQLLRRVKQLETRNEAQQQTIQNNLVRIEHLESRDNDQQKLILNLRSELVVQRQRTGSLERFIGKISKVACQPAEKKKGVSQTGIQPGKILPAQTAYVEENSPDDQKVSGYDMYKTPSRIRRADNEETIAFFATLTNHLEHAGVQQTFVFDRIVTNLGHGYNNHSGNFIAPVSGTYVFSATLISLYHQSSHSQFTKNGQAVSYMYVSGAEAGYDTTSQTIVVQLHKGDDVCIHNIDADKSYHGAHYSTFSGFLLQQDFTEQVVVGKK